MRNAGFVRSTKRHYAKVRIRQDNFRIVPKSVLTPTDRPADRRAIPKQLRLFPHVRFRLLSAKLFLLKLCERDIIIRARRTLNYNFIYRVPCALC